MPRSAKRPRTIAGIRKHLQYGPMQNLKLMNSSQVAVTTNNQVAYKEVKWNSRGLMQDYMDTYQPYFVMPGLTEGAPNTYSSTPVLVQKNMSSVALGNREARLKIEGGKVVMHFRNNWDIAGNISLSLFRANCDASVDPVALAGHHIDEVHHADVSIEDLLMDGISIGKKAIDDYWTQVGRTQQIVLHPTEEFTYEFKLPRGTFNENLAASQAEQNIKGLTMVLVMRIQGMIIHELGVSNEVGYGTCTLDYIMRQYSNFRHIEDQPLSAHYQDITLPTITTAVGKVEPVVDEDGDGDQDSWAIDDAP